LGGREGEGALSADGEHGRVDVGDCDGYGGVGVEDVGGVKHAEGDVPGAAGDVEDVLGGKGVGGGGEGGEAWVEGGDELVSGRRGLVGVVLQRMGGDELPYAMPAEGHEIVHPVVGLCYAGEDACDALALLGLGDCFEAEMCWSGGVGYGIFGGLGGVGRRAGGRS
jgi:hypothetical protein